MDILLCVIVFLLLVGYLLWKSRCHEKGIHDLEVKIEFMSEKIKSIDHQIK